MVIPIGASSLLSGKRLAVTIRRVLLGFERARSTQESQRVPQRQSVSCSLPASVPAGPIKGCEWACRRATRFRAAPRSMSDGRSRPVSGLVGSGVSPSRELALAVAGPRNRRKAPDRPLIDTPAHHLPLRGQQRTWQSKGEDPRSRNAAPLSRFNPARGTRRDTSNERLDCTTQVDPADPTSVWESTLKTNAYTLT